MKRNQMKRIMIAIILAEAASLGVANSADNDRPCVSHPAPYNLTAVGLESDVVHLQWTPGDNSGVSFDIQHSVDGIVWEHINCGYAIGRYNDTYELMPSTTYYYRVRAHKCGSANIPECFSAYSNVTTATTTATDPDGK